MNIRFSAYSAKGDANTINVALPAELQSILTLKRINFVNSLEYFGKQGHQDVLNASNSIIKQLKNSWHYTDSFGVRHSYQNTLFFYTRFYLHYWLMHLYIVDCAIKKHNPKRIYVDTSTPVFGDNQTFEDVIRSYVESNALDIEIVGRSKQYRNSVGRRKRVVSLLSSTMSVFFWLRQPFLKSKKVVWVADDSYGMHGLLGKLKDKDPKVFPVYLAISKNKIWAHVKNALTGKELFFVHGDGDAKTSKSLQKSLKHFIQAINKYKNTKTLDFLGVDLSDTLSTYVKESAAKEMALVENSVKQIHNLLSMQKPALTVSQYALGYSYALGEICTMKNIPGLLITHGTHTPQDSDVYAKMEWKEHAKTIINAHFSHTAIQSPMAGKFLQSLGDVCSIGLKTGPLLYANTQNQVKEKILTKCQLIGGQNKHKKVVIHAGTPKDVHAFRPWVYETVDEYIRNINDLIEAVDKLTDVYLILRFRPSAGLSKEVFSNLVSKSENCAIYSDGAFEDYLSISDMLVSYSSTTIEEALQNNVPVLQYDHDDKYMHIKAPTVDHKNFKINPIYYCGQEGNLSQSIKLILENLEPIQADQAKWEDYRYSIDAELSWLERLYKYDQFKPIQ